MNVHTLVGWVLTLIFCGVSAMENEFGMTDAANDSFGGVVVEIVAVNDIPNGFSLLTPPLYYLTTSITLFCHVHGSTGNIEYTWSRTSASTFTSNSTSVFNRNTFLTSTDAGVYTCSASDSDGRQGKASLEIKFNGAEVYLVTSHNIKSRLVANNSFIVHKPSNCSTEDCFTDIYCYSNSSRLMSGAVVFPNDRAHSNNTLLGANYNVRVSESAIHLVVPNGERYDLNAGIFTFLIPDSNGNILHLSLGLYTFTAHQGPPDVVTDYTGYTDLTKDTSTSTMAELVCYSTNTPPTSVVWLRNGEKIDVDGVMYESMQIVADRRNSHYYNVLVVKDVINIIGKVTFTCNISNFYGSSSFDIATDIEVMPTVQITPSVVTNFEGHPVVLDCEGTVDRGKAATQLVHGNHITVEWIGPHGLSLKGHDFIIGNDITTNSAISRSLTIPDAQIVHSGLYACQVTLHLLNNITHSVTSQYHLVLLKNITVTLPTSVVDPTVDDMQCTWRGGEIARMEWLFLGNNTIVPMEYTNNSWNGEVLECRVQQEVLSFKVKASFTNVVNIEASTDTPTAGENITLTCTVTSDRPTIMKWIGNGVGSEGVVVHSQDNNGFNSTLVIEFSPLRTSHGGVYTCVSSISQSPSTHDSQLDHSLRVHVPAPTLTTSTEPSDQTQHLSNTRVNLVCVVEYASEVNTDVIVHTLWTSPKTTLITNSSRISFIEEQHSHILISTLTIHSLLLSDSDVYTCIATVMPIEEYSSRVLGSNSTKHLTLTVSLNVSILVDYHPPHDFTLPSPPYYRPASSVTLTCVVVNGVSPVSYTWTSNCSRCFASNSRSSRLTKTILTYNDAGVHKCSVSDARGNAGFATTEMKLYGAGAYVQYSRDVSFTAVANNTEIKLSCNTCQLDFRCFSNTSSVAKIIVTGGSSYSSYNARPLYIQRQSNSGVRLFYSYYRFAYSNPPSGIYTCTFEDYFGNNKNMDISVGVNFEYSSVSGVPTISSSFYNDTSRLASSESLAEITCVSNSSTVNNVTWLRSGKDVSNISGYVENILVKSRQNFSLAHSLSVSDVAGIMGNITYTCIIQNQYGRASKDVTFNNTVSTIVASTKPFYGNEFVLKCRARLPPSGYTVDMRLEWYGPNGLMNTADIVVGESYTVDGYMERDAVFACPTQSLNRVYECQLTAYFESTNEMLVETNEYYLEVLSKLSTSPTFGGLFPYISGYSESVTCSWNGDDIYKLEWFLEDITTIPILSETNLPTLTLFPDTSTSGLNGTNFTCRATTSKGDQFEETVTLCIKEVTIDILVIYERPPQYVLPSPPYYRPASTVSLRCNINGARQPIRYHWTLNSSFLSKARQILFRRLALENVGVYICSATDDTGIVYTASTNIALGGGGVYVQRSVHTFFDEVANNTALVPRFIRDYSSSSRNYVYELIFYCSFNGSDSYPEIVLPDGRVVSTYTDYGISSTRTSELTFNYRAERTPATGIYTCRFNDPNGLRMDISVGIYGSASLAHFLVHREYTDTITNSIIPGSVLATYVCESVGFPPTTLTWERNDVVLDIDDIRYSTVQIVTNRSASHFKNILQVYNITDLLDDPVYRCSVGSDFGSVSGVIQQGLTVSGSIQLRTSSTPEYNTQFDLICQTVIPQQYIRHLANYIDIEWSGPESVISQVISNSSETVSIKEDLELLTSTITFLSPNSSHNGNYSCQASIRLQNRALVIGESNNVVLSLEGISITGSEGTHIAGPPVELKCVGKDTDISRIEWISDGNTILAEEDDTSSLSLMVNTSIILNREWFTCRTTTINGYQQHKRVLVTVRELVHRVAITSSSEMPIAGENFTLRCTVYSDLPATVAWFRQEVDSSTGVSVTHEIDSTQTVVNDTGGEFVSKLYLEFRPLLATHGTVYTCNSLVNITSTRRTASESHQLKVQIPRPLVSVSTLTGEDITIGSLQILKCSVTVTTVNIPVTLQVRWNSPTSLYNESTILLSGAKEQRKMRNLDLVLDSYKYIDSGVYTCTAVMMAAGNTSAIVKDGISSSTLTVTAINAFKVSIQVDYNPPPDFSLQTPPYYRPASSVTLRCIARNAADRLNYQWTSTQNRSFVHGRNESVIFQRLLTAYDAGLHTCTVTDEKGNTGTATTKMTLFGMGIYVEESQNIANTSIANNTNLYPKQHCEGNCKPFSFCCYSNMTEREIVLQYPKRFGSVYSFNGNQFSYTSGEVDPWVKSNITSLSGSCISLTLTEYNINHVGRGTYSCEAVNSNVSTPGSQQLMNIGVYTSSDQPALSGMNYTDFTTDDSTSTLAVVTCETRNIQPQNVSWLRNRELLSIDGQDYEIKQHLQSREGSVYSNSLIIRDVIGLINSPTYTCNISSGNLTVTSSANIHIDLAVEVEVSIRASSSKVNYGDDFTLTCETHTLESKPSLTNRLLQSYLTVEWFDNNNISLTTSKLLTVEEISSEFSRSLHFHPVTNGHDRLYRCVATLHFPGAQSINASSQYRLLLDIAFIQLKFDSISCSFLSEYQTFATNLETSIKTTLTSVINQKCSCNFTSEMIAGGEFGCVKSSSITYRTSLEGSSDVQSTKKMLDTLQTWKRRYGNFLFSSSFSLRLWVDPFCPLEIQSFQDPLCRV